MGALYAETVMAQTDVDLDFGSSGTTTPNPKTIPERIALGEHNMRGWIAVSVVVTFILTNGAILYGLYLALQVDIDLASKSVANHTRFIDHTVIAALLAATTTQLGAIIFLIARYLFPSKTN